MRVDWDKVWRDRIKEIDKQIKKCIFNKKWTEKAKLESEKANLLEKINKNWLKSIIKKLEMKQKRWIILSLYKKTEAMLYNFNKTKAEIRNIELDLELLKSQYEGVGAIVYEERTGSTNKFNSSVENEVVIKEKRIKKLENMKKLKEVEIMKIENSLTDLTNREKNLIQMRYFNKENNRMIAAKLDLTEEYVSELKRIIVNKISNILFLNFV